MKPIHNYENVQILTGNERLPVGGYMIDIIGAEEVEYTWGSVLEIKFDIAEGDYKGFYTNQYTNSQMEDKKYKGTYRLNIPKGDGSEMDEFTARKFKTNIVAIEESNPGFHWDWDELKLVGRKAGAVFFEKEWEYNGKTGFYTTIYTLKSAEDIHNGKFKIPEPKLLPKKEPEFNSNETEALDDGLPF